MQVCYITHHRDGSVMIQMAIERLRIQYGTSYGYPISSMGSHVSASPNHQLHRQTPLWTRANTAFFGTFGYELDLAQLGEDELSELKFRSPL